MHQHQQNFGILSVTVDCQEEKKACASKGEKNDDNALLVYKRLFLKKQKIVFWKIKIIWKGKTKESRRKIVGMCKEKKNRSCQIVVERSQKNKRWKQ